MDACVKAILCPLGSGVLEALNGILAAQVAVLEAQVAAITAQLVVLEVQLVVPAALRTVAVAVVDEVRAVGNLVPVALMADCLELGALSLGLNAALDSTVAAADRLIASVNRTLAFKAELEAERDAILATIAQFGEIRLAIAECP